MVEYHREMQKINHLLLRQNQLRVRERKKEFQASKKEKKKNASRNQVFLFMLGMMYAFFCAYFSGVLNSGL